MKNVPEFPEIDGLITLGSPLGLDEVQNKLAFGRPRENSFFVRQAEGDLAQFHDPLDIVSRPDPKLTDDFWRGGQNVVTDHVQTNSDAWRQAMTKYLARTQVREATWIAFGLPNPNA